MTLKPAHSTLQVQPARHLTGSLSSQHAPQPASIISGRPPPTHEQC